MLPYLGVLFMVATVTCNHLAAAFLPPSAVLVDTTACQGCLLSLCGHSQFSSGDRKGPNTETFETSVIVTTKVLLPGETTRLTLKADKQASIYDAVEASMDKDGRSFLTLGVQVFANDLGLEGNDGDSDDLSVENESLENYEATTMTQVASYCEFLKCHAATNHAGEVDLELQCIARIHLLDIVSHPQDARQSTLRFQAEWVPEMSIMPPQELQHAAAICRSIDSLMQKTSKMQETIDRKEMNGTLTVTNTDEKTPCNTMWQHFQATRDNVSHVLREDLLREHGATTNDSSSIADFDDKLHLVSTSWAIFTCLADDKLEARYRLRALDWDNLLERLKLGLYTLREKQLLLQGRLLSLSEKSEMIEDSGCIITSSSDAFQ